MKPFLIFILSLLFVVTVKGQNPPFVNEKPKENFSGNKNGDTSGNHLKVLMELAERVSFDEKCWDCAKEGLYKFRIKKIYYGYYGPEFIQVKCALSRRDTNFWRNGYWWVLIKTSEKNGNLPVYSHSGNF